MFGFLLRRKVQSRFDPLSGSCYKEDDSGESYRGSHASLDHVIFRKPFWPCVYSVIDLRIETFCC